MRNLWQNKGIPLRGLMAVCLAFVLMLSLSPNVFAVTAGATETSPDVTITAIGVDDTYVELGINVQAQSNGFRSVGAVLTYDPTLLTPVDWAAQPASVNVTEQPADADTYTAEEARTDWNNVAVPMGTKGPDILSGKTALVFHKKVSDTAKAGYLYLSAEAPKLIAGATEVDGVLTGGWNQALPELSPDKAGDTANGVPYYTPKDDAKLETPVEQSVVVRFKLKGDDMSAALASIDLAAGNAAKGAPINDESGVAYFHNDKGESLAVNVRILRAVKGTTYFTGGGGGSGPADPSDFVTVVCFDWDNTLLGSVTVPKGASAEDVKPYMDAFVKSLQSPESKDLDPAKENYFVNNVNYPLTYKRGYSFNTWLPYDSDLPTHCGRAVDGTNKKITISDPKADGTDQSFDNLTENISVKACYIDNEELYYPTRVADMAYTIEIIRYSRIAATANFIITYRVAREKKVTVDGVETVVGLPRATEPQLRLQVNGNQYNFFALATSDIATFTFYPHGTGTTRAVAVMVDFYQAPVLTNASAKTNSLTEVNGSSNTDLNGFRLKGTVGLINEELAANSTQYLTVLMLGTYAGFTTVTNTNLADARANLRTAWLKLNSTDGTEATLKPPEEQIGLTHAQMKHAIENNGDLTS